MGLYSGEAEGQNVHQQAVDVLIQVIQLWWLLEISYLGSSTKEDKNTVFCKTDNCWSSRAMDWVVFSACGLFLFSTAASKLHEFWIWFWIPLLLFTLPLGNLPQHSLQTALFWSLLMLKLDHYWAINWLFPATKWITVCRLLKINWPLLSFLNWT